MPGSSLRAEVEVREDCDHGTERDIDFDEFGSLARRVQREAKCYYRRGMPYGHSAGLGARPSQIGWLTSDRWRAMAARLGPLAYSQLGVRAVPAPEPLEAVARWLSMRLDTWWDQDGRPDPWTVVVVSGDDGSLARRVLDTRPECSEALRYVIVDPAMADSVVSTRARVGAKVALEEPESLYPVGDPSSADGAPVLVPRLGAFQSCYPGTEDAVLARGVGPLVSVMGDIPAASSAAGGVDGNQSGAVVAISVLGAQAFDLYTASGASPGDDAAEAGPVRAWSEVRLAVSASVTPATSDLPIPVAPDSEPGELADVEAEGGDAIAIHVGAVEWLRRALHGAPPGRLVAVEEWSDTAVRLTADRAATLGGFWATPPRSVSLCQLARVRRPDSTSPVPVAANLCAVTWSRA